MNPWISQYKNSESKCGHTKNDRCDGATCTYQRRMHYYHCEYILAIRPISCDGCPLMPAVAVVAGLVLPFWKQISRINQNMKVVRVSIQQRRIVGVNVFPRCIDDVKEIISQGLDHSGRLESRLKGIPESAFLVPCMPPLLTHDCLSTSGIENLEFIVSPSLAPGTVFFLRFFAIPLADPSKLSNTGKLKAVPWRSCPAVNINGQRVQVSSCWQKSTCPLVLDRALIRTGHNSVKVVSTGDRLFLLLQVGRNRSIDEVRICLTQIVVNIFAVGETLLACFCAGH